MNVQAQPQEPRDFGKYRLVRKVADGGMGTIYLALSQGPDGFAKPCALKTIRPQVFESPEFMRMLAQEARVAALLSHPNIVQVFDYGHVGGVYFLTMEWVDGASVGQLMTAAARKGTALGPQFAAQVGMSVAEALAHIHAGVFLEDRVVSLVHRDVSPGNILVSTAGSVKLTDFGIVKVLEAPTTTAVGVVKGKHGYMAPEQIRAEEVDHRADIFSLGVVLYEMLTGRRLFKRKELSATVAAVLAGRVPQPSAINPEVPAALDDIVLRCLKRRREARIQSAAELYEALHQFYLSQNWSVSTRELAEVVRAMPGVRAPSSSSGVERARALPFSQPEITRDGEEVEAEPVRLEDDDDEEPQLSIDTMPPVTPDDPMRSISESSTAGMLQTPTPDLSSSAPLSVQADSEVAAGPPGLSQIEGPPRSASAPAQRPSPERDSSLLLPVLTALAAGSVVFWWLWLQQ